MLLKLEFLIVQVYEGVVIEGNEKKLLKNIKYENQLSEQEESKTRAVREL